MKPAAATKRKRFERSVPGHSLTSKKLDLLQTVALSHFLTTDQVARAHGLSLRATREHLRNLYDLELLDLEGVSHEALKTGAFGLASKVHVPTRKGLIALYDRDMLPERKQKLPGGSVTIGHQLAIRDVGVWVMVSARNHRASGHEVERWECAEVPDVGDAKPDGLFVYQFAPGDGGEVQVGIVEADMGTERGMTGPSDKWGKKIAAYSAVFGEESRDTLYKAIGFEAARLVVTVETDARASWIAKRVAGSVIAPFTWIAKRTDLLNADVYVPVWLRPDGVRKGFL